VTPDPTNPQAQGGAAVFRTTRWSVVLAAGKLDTEASRDALEALCQTYWYPVYAYVRRRGASVEDAEDLTQAFFARFLARGRMDRANPERGRFRGFLLASLRNFLADEHDRATARKRGAGTSPVSLDQERAEGRFQAEPATELTPEALYVRSWANTLLERVFLDLRAACEEQGTVDRFDHLKPYLWGGHAAAPYREVADRLGLSEGAVKVAVGRLRARFQECLRQEIAQTVDSPDEIEEEIRFLIAAFQ